MNNTQTLIATLEGAPDIIISLVREVPPQNLKRRPSPNKWSAHEHACHISTVDTEPGESTKRSAPRFTLAPGSRIGFAGLYETWRPPL